MSIHRKDRPDAPVRVKRSTLNVQTWLWACWTNSTTSSGHRGHGYPSWEDAFAAMEKHRRAEHTYVLDERMPRFTEDDVEIVVRDSDPRIADLVAREFRRQVRINHVSFSEIR